MAIKMTHVKEASMAMNSRRLTRSLLIRKPRIADQRGFVWKMIMMNVMGSNCRFTVNSKKLRVPKRDLACACKKRTSKILRGILEYY